MKLKTVTIGLTLPDHVVVPDDKYWVILYCNLRTGNNNYARQATISTGDGFVSYARTPLTNEPAYASSGSTVSAPNSSNLNYTITYFEFDNV